MTPDTPPLPKLTLKQLAIFVSIYQTGSTSAASESLHLSQSAVSSALGTLEARLQMPLFERVGRRLLPHHNAHAIYVQAQTLLEQAVSLEQYHEHQAAQIRIGASTTIGNYALPPLIAQLYGALPEAHIDVTIANTQEIIREVEQLTVDMALVEGTPRPSDAKQIVQRAWRTDTLIIFAKVGSQWLDASDYDADEQCYRLSLQQLARLPLLVREVGSGTRQVIDAQLLQHMPDARVMMAVQQSEAIKHMVCADVGIGCLSQHVIQPELRSGSLVPVKVTGINLARTWWLVWHKARHKSTVWQTFMTLLNTDKA
ncbi:LysR substrate-binding domain-containing protein [Psychrobacter aestuarii]|uniref:DNA-binding transcriptional regulator YeiE n=1 Tax=Psychrobacter aestuarii TaxID=556327 RepID=A0ABN0VTH7_9GAMM|nr:LysR substrate-binding domain-containing protein [Psychrobacter aestuarii]